MNGPGSVLYCTALEVQRLIPNGRDEQQGLVSQQSLEEKLMKWVEK